MNLRESLWIRERLARIPDADLFPVLDVGSSTLDYRTRVQPWIDENLFAPLRARGGKVIHADVKQAPGIDLVVDLLDPGDRARLRSLAPRAALVCNVLEHLPERGPLARAVVDLLPPGGHVVVTGPYRYPRHDDPVDTMFRPTPEEVAREFPGTRLLEGAVIDSGNWREWSPGERGRSLGRFLARMCLPLHRPAEWARLVPHVPYLFRHMKAYAAVLRKTA